MARGAVTTRNAKCSVLSFPTGVAFVSAKEILRILDGQRWALFVSQENKVFTLRPEY